jgi:hypothetical protein
MRKKTIIMIARSPELFPNPLFFKNDFFELAPIIRPTWDLPAIFESKMNMESARVWFFKVGSCGISHENSELAAAGSGL